MEVNGGEWSLQHIPWGVVAFRVGDLGVDRAAAWIHAPIATDLQRLRNNARFFDRAPPLPLIAPRISGHAQSTLAGNWQIARSDLQSDQAYLERFKLDNPDDRLPTTLRRWSLQCDLLQRAIIAIHGVGGPSVLPQRSLDGALKTITQETITYIGPLPPTLEAVLYRRYSAGSINCRAREYAISVFGTAFLRLSHIERARLLRLDPGLPLSALEPDDLSDTSRDLRLCGFNRNVSNN
jgi:hypothetical protein